MKKRIFPIAALLICISSMVAYAAIPGKHRALTPSFFGMTEIAPNIWIDKPAIAEKALALVQKGADNSAAFYGDSLAEPHYILCSEDPCTKRFGLTTRGLAFGAQLILIGPKGMNEMILTHERIHADLHSMMDYTDLITQRYPIWFNEGLATHFSQDDRVVKPATVRDALWIQKAQTFSDWGRITHRDNWRQTYGAAAYLVEEIEAKIGREGLRQLVYAVAEGEDFDQKIIKIMGEEFITPP